MELSLKFKVQELKKRNPRPSDKVRARAPERTAKENPRPETRCIVPLRLRTSLSYLRVRFLDLPLAWRVRKTLAVGLEARRVRRVLRVGWDLRAFFFGADFLRADFFLGSGLCISEAKACCADSTFEAIAPSVEPMDSATVVRIDESLEELGVMRAPD